MNQRQLEYFLRVYEKKSISGAAESLFISPQGLSKTIAKLEKELGIELFAHEANRIVPTAAAASLASHAMNILTEYDIIENKLFQNTVSKKSVGISCSFDVPQMISADFFYEFYQKNPDILIQIHEYPDRLILEQLERAFIEIAVISGPLDHSLYEFVPLFTEPFCLVINKKHPLAKKEFICISDLQDVPLAVKDMYNQISVTQFAEFQKKNAIPNIILETSDSHLIHSMAENNYALGMTLKYLAEKIRNENIVIRPFEKNCFTKTLYLVKHKDYILSKEAKLVYDGLFEFFNLHPPA